MSSLQVAHTILEQLGGKRFLAMTGARSLAGSENSLSFRLPRAAKGIKGVRIELTPADTYTMTFLKVKKFEVKEVAKHEDVYFDQLQEIFTRETGLDTHL